MTTLFPAEPNNKKKQSVPGPAQAPWGLYIGFLYRRYGNAGDEAGSRGKECSQDRGEEKLKKRLVICE